MILSTSIFSLPRELEPCLMLVYVVVIFIGARVMEFFARVHFARADRNAHEGFEYDDSQDVFRCNQGARLSLHVLKERAQVAVYRAPASRCASCAHKSRCTPNDSARHVYRSLVTWAETDMGRFQGYVSIVMFASAGVLSGVALFKWGGHPGTAIFILAVAVSIVLLWNDLRSLCNQSLSKREDLADRPK